MPPAAVPVDAVALLALATEAATAAGALLLSSLTQPRTGVSSKSSATDMVTDMDRACERLVVDHIRAARPDDGVEGEEGARRPSSSGVVWLIDPIDGTTNYLYGYPAFSVSVAAAVDGVTRAGCVHDPMKGETFTASRGGGAHLRRAWAGLDSPLDRPLVVEATGGAIDLALIGTGFGYRAERRAAQAAILTTVLPAVRDVRRAGSAALDLCSVAAGRLDGYYERGLHAWDHAAGALVAAEAGAWVGSLEGGPLGDDTTIVAARPDLAAPLCDLLRRAGAGGPLA